MFSKESQNHFRYQQIKIKIIIPYKITRFLKEKIQNEIQKSTISKQSQPKSFFPAKKIDENQFDIQIILDDCKMIFHRNKKAIYFPATLIYIVQKY